MKKLKTAKPKTIHVLALALAIASLGAGLALANGTVELPRQVLSGGASGATAAGGVSLRATLGQPVVGVVSDGDVTLGQGFWHGGAAGYRIYLPLVVKNDS
jgi:hypothetical protein